MSLDQGESYPLSLAWVEALALGVKRGVEDFLSLAFDIFLIAAHLVKLKKVLERFLNPKGGKNQFIEFNKLELKH